MSQIITKEQAVGLLRRKCAESSQSQVARAVGVSESMVSYVLLGKRPLTGELAAYLGLRVTPKTVYSYRLVDKKRKPLTDKVNGSG